MYDEFMGGGSFVRVRTIFYGQGLLLRYSGLLRRIARTSGIVFLAVVGLSRLSWWQVVCLWALFHPHRDNCIACWSWFTCTLMSCCGRRCRAARTFGGAARTSRVFSLLRPVERRVFLFAPGLALLPRRSGTSECYSVCGPQSRMVSGVLTGLLFNGDCRVRRLRRTNPPR